MLPRRILFTLMIAALTLAACQPAMPPAAPTQDPAVIEATLNAVKTAAVQTAVAELTLNAPTLTETPAATDTPVPTATFVPTVTAFPSVTPLPPTATFVPWTATPYRSPTPSDFNCTINEVSPAAGTRFAPNAPFDGRWVIENTGTEEWVGGDTDVRYSSGTEFQENVKVIDLSGDIDPGEEFTVIVDMLAPKQTGSYSTVWVVNYGGRIVCTLPLSIVVAN